MTHTFDCPAQHNGDRLNRREGSWFKALAGLAIAAFLCVRPASADEGLSLGEIVSILDAYEQSVQDVSIVYEVVSKEDGTDMGRFLRLKIEEAQTANRKAHLQEILAREQIHSPTTEIVRIEQFASSSGREYFRSVQGNKDSIQQSITKGVAWVTEVFYKEGVTTHHTSKPKERSVLITADPPPIHGRLSPRDAVCWRGKQWSEFIKENISTITRVPQNGNDYYVIEVLHEKESNEKVENHHKTVLTLDPEKAYLPIKMETGDVATLLQKLNVVIPSWSPLERFPTVVYDFQWSEADDNGHYRLLSATRTVYTWDKDGRFAWGFATMTVSSCLYNLDLPDSFFEREFTSGTKVTDKTKRTGSKPYIVP